MNFKSNIELLTLMTIATGIAKISRNDLDAFLYCLILLLFCLLINLFIKSEK